MKNRFSLFLLFLLPVLPSPAQQQVTIRGIAPAKAYAGKEISAFRYTDLISYRRETQESDTVKADGQFTLKFDLHEAQRIYLLCDHLKAPLYVEPGRTYEVGFPPKDSTHYYNPNLEQRGDLSIRMNDTTELNYLITRFNIRFDDFWKKNNEYFVVKQWAKIQTLLDSFRLRVFTDYKKIPVPYFHSYVDYTIASNEVSTFESENVLFKKYLKDKPVLYTNSEYMEFFNQFFDKYFYQFALKPQGSYIYQAINDKGSYPELMGALKPAPYLQNDTLRELEMLKGLFENYFNHEFSQSKIVGILEEVSTESKIPEHRQIALDIISHFSVLKRGTQAPDFSLPDKTGKIHNLSDYKGNYIYLMFWSGNCSVCMNQLKYLAELEKKYPHITLISISLDDKEEDMKKVLKQYPKWNWVFLYAGKAEQLRHDYNILSIPYSYVIGPEGKLLFSPAPAPSDGLEEIFNVITRKKQKKYKIGE